jgi:hypothetical protein
MIMNNSKAIFQEIETKLAKDDYASSLPIYHPAKGRRKRVIKGPQKTFKSTISLQGTGG